MDILLKKLSSNGTWIRTIHTVGRTISHENKPSRCVPHFGSSKRGSLGKLQRVLNHIGSTSMNYNDHRRHNTSLVQDPCVYAASCRKYNICLESTYIHYNMNSSYTKKKHRDLVSRKHDNEKKQLERHKVLPPMRLIINIIKVPILVFIQCLSNVWTNKCIPWSKHMVNINALRSSVPQFGNPCILYIL